MSRTNRILLGMWLAVLVGAVGSIAWHASRESKPASEKTAMGGPFSLTDQDGHAFTDANLIGKPSLIYFGYTYCPDVCPTSLQLIETAVEMLGPDATQKVNIVFITIDPERDTTQVMKGFVPAFGSTIVGLTGSADQVARAANAYLVFYEKVPSKDKDTPYLMSHSSIIYLLNRQGHFVKTFAPDTEAEEIAKGVKELL